MAVYEPIYRYTVYAPRSEDATETTIMSPAASAPHSDPFKVASHEGVTGFKPYLAHIPRGRRGQLDFLKCKHSTGRITLSNVDMRIGTDPLDNLERWFTAFTGSTGGRDRIKGAKVYIEESLDGGSTWDDFYTGRIVDWKIIDRNKFILTLRDLVDDLKTKVFVGTDHAPSATNSDPQFPMVCPVGFQTSYAARGVTSLLESSFKSGTGVTRTVEMRNTQLGRSHPRNIVTKNLTEGAEKSFFSHGIFGYTIQEHFRLYYDNGTSQGEFKIRRLVTVGRSLRGVEIEELDSSHPEYLAFPIATENTDVAVVYRGPPTEAFPLYIDNVHPFELLEDILNGEYSQLNASGNPIWTYDFDATEMAAFQADLTWGTVRFKITDEEKMHKWIESKLGQVIGFFLRWEPDGTILPVDLRTPKGLTPVTIGNADLDEAISPEWVSEGDATTKIRALWYRENFIPTDVMREIEEQIPDIPLGGLREFDMVLDVIDIDSLTDLGDERFTIEGDGFRSLLTQTMYGGTIAHAWHRRVIERRIEEIFRIMSRGGSIASFRTHRASSVSGVNLCLVGDYRLVDLDELPDPSTNKRGGVRLMLCISREEDGLGINFEFLDSGLNVVAGVPTFTLLTLTTGDAQHSVDVTVTDNAASELIEVHYAITTTAVGTRPVEGSELWTYATIMSTGTRSINNLPSGKRIWVRARSLPKHGTGVLRQPSNWVFPASPTAGYVTTSSLAVPSATSESNVTNVSALLAWSVGISTLPLRVKVGTTNPPTEIVAELPEGSTQHRAVGLTLGTLYYWQVYHFDPLDNSEGAAASDSFTTTSATGTTAPETGEPIVLIGANARGVFIRDIDSLDPAEILTGVYMEARLLDATLQVEVQHNTAATANGNEEQLLILPPGQVTFVHLIPTDGVARYYRTRHLAGGLFDNDGPWGEWSGDATPGLLPDGILEATAYTGKGGVNSADPERLIAPTGTDKWAILE